MGFREDEPGDTTPGRVERIASREPRFSGLLSGFSERACLLTSRPS
jgi:hypothetical protein